MARLNSGGFAAGFESGFGLVQKAKKDKRDFELQQESLRQKDLDRKADAQYRTDTLNQRKKEQEATAQYRTDTLALQEKESEARIAENKDPNSLKNIQKKQQISKLKREEEEREATIFRSTLEKAIGSGDAPTEKEIELLMDSKYFNLMQYVTPEWQQSVKDVGSFINRAVDPKNNTTLPKEFIKPEAIAALNVMLGDEINQNLREGEANEVLSKSIMSLEVVPQSLLPEGSSPAVMVNLLVQNPDGTMKLDKLTMGRDDNPDADIQITTVDQFFERYFGLSVAAAAFENVRESGNLQVMYDRVANVTGANNSIAIQNAARKEWNQNSTFIREETGFETMGEYVADQVNQSRIQASNFKKPEEQVGTKGYLIETLREGIENYRDLRNESNNNQRKYSEKLSISSAAEATDEQLVEFFNAIIENNKVIESDKYRNEDGTANRRADRLTEEVVLNSIHELFGIEG